MIQVQKFKKVFYWNTIITGLLVGPLFLTGLELESGFSDNQQILTLLIMVGIVWLAMRSFNKSLHPVTVVISATVVLVLGLLLYSVIDFGNYPGETFLVFSLLLSIGMFFIFMHDIKTINMFKHLKTKENNKLVPALKDFETSRMIAGCVSLIFSGVLCSTIPVEYLNQDWVLLFYMSTVILILTVNVISAVRKLGYTKINL